MASLAGSGADLVASPAGRSRAPRVTAQGLTGQQKAAVIVRLLLSEGATPPLLALPDHMQAAVTEQMGAMRMVDRDTLALVVAEFCDRMEQVGLSFPGGVDGALKMLDGHISPTAAGRLRRLSGGGAAGDDWEKIAAMEPEILVPVLTDESIEVSAVILSKLPVPKAADLLGRLPGERARRIAYCVSQTEGIAPDTVDRIGRALIAQLDARPPRAFEGDPVKRVGAILNISTSAMRDDVLRGLDETDSDLAEKVRKTIFTFIHIPARVVARDIPKILRGVEQDTLLKALGGAVGEGPEAAAEFILANMSQRLAATLREEMAAQGKVREKDADLAQTAIILAIRDLEEQGEITLVQQQEEGADPD